MNSVSASRSSALRSGSARLGLSALLSWAAMIAPAAAQAESTEINPYVSKVVASYNIRFNGVGIGDFKFWSRLTNRQYSMSAKASISVLLGMAMEWKGATSSSGMVTAKGPLPASYSFAYQSSDKHEQVRLKFANNAVQEVTVNPPKVQKAGLVPITGEHLRDVVDPLSAVILLSRMGARKNGAEACERRLPIFDGKMRYDLVFNYKGTRRVDSESGYSGPAYVCGVKFIPIAGHKAGRKVEGLGSSDAIEVWLVPVPDAHLVVPYHVSIPTPAGSASMTSERFEIETPAQGRKRALVF